MKKVKSNSRAARRQAEREGGKNNVLEMELKEQLKGWQEQTDAWKQRVTDLESWVCHLEDVVEYNNNLLEAEKNESEVLFITSRLHETKDKIYNLKVEIEAKRNAIEKRERDMSRSKAMLEQNMTKLKTEWGGVIAKLRELAKDEDGTLAVEHKQIVRGILTRADNGGYRNGQQQFNDMELAKNIIKANQSLKPV